MIRCAQPRNGAPDLFNTLAGSHLRPAKQHERAMYRLMSSGILLIVGLAGAVTAPSRRLAAQAFDSTAMPSLEQLALETGRASRRHPIRGVLFDLLCDPEHPLIDSASVAACGMLSGPKAGGIIAAFARGVELPVVAATDPNAAPEASNCPADPERVAEPRVLVARLTAPVVGVREGVWEGRLIVELRCRSPGGGIRTMGKSYLYQWSGREWKMYQHSWWHSGR